MQLLSLFKVIVLLQSHEQSNIQSAVGDFVSTKSLLYAHNTTDGAHYSLSQQHVTKPSSSDVSSTPLCRSPLFLQTMVDGISQPVSKNVRFYWLEFITSSMHHFRKVSSRGDCLQRQQLTFRAMFGYYSICHMS